MEKDCSLLVNLLKRERYTMFYTQRNKKFALQIP